MDFITDFMLSEKQKYNFVWVIICWLTRIDHFISFHKTVIDTKLAKLFFKKIAGLYLLPDSIVFARSSTSTFQF